MCRAGGGIIDQPACNLRIGGDVSTGRLLDGRQVLHARRLEPPAHELDDSDEDVAVDVACVSVEVNDGLGVAVGDVEQDSVAAEVLFKRQGEAGISEE